MTHRLISTSLCALLAGVGSTAAAAMVDPQINDLRVGIGYSPTDYGSDVSDADSAWRISVQGMRSYGEMSDVGGWIYGAELSYTGADFPGDASASTIAVTGFGGWAYALPQLNRLHFEGTPFVGVGFTKLDAGSEDDTGFYYELGLRAAAYYTFASRWQIGVDLRYLWGHATATIAGTDVDVDPNGLVAMIQAGYRF